MKKVLKYLALCLWMLSVEAAFSCAYAETINSYGNEYIAISNYKPGEHCVITALFEPTVVTFSNGKQITLLRGERYTADADQWTTPDGIRTRTLYIHASEPIHVRHTTSFGETFVTSDLPSLSCIASTEQTYTFPRKVSKASLFLLVPASKTAGFMLDGKVLKFRNSYVVEGNGDWLYEVIDLGTRKAGSTVTITAPTNLFHAAVVADTYTWLADCELEASLIIDTIHGTPVNNLHIDSTLLYADNMVSAMGETAQMTEGSGAYAAYEEEPQDTVVPERIVFHRASLYIQGSYAAMPLKMTGYNTSMGLGYGAGAGILYEFQRKSFMMQTGVGFYWLDRRIDIHDQPAPNRYDRSLAGGIEVPLMFGQNFKEFYYLLGIKTGLDLFWVYKTACSPLDVSPTSSAIPTSDQLRIKPDIEREQRINKVLDFDTRLSAELGFNLGKQRQDWVHTRLAFFADWGFYPANLTRVVVPDDSHPVSTIVEDPDDYTTYQLTHFYYLHESYGSAGCFLHHFQVGLKLSLVIGK